MSDLMDTRINIKSETQSDVRRGWRLSGHAAERRFAWKVMLSENLWCMSSCAWAHRSMGAGPCALCSQGLPFWVTAGSWLKAEPARRDKSNVCRCFSIAVGFSCTESFLPHQFNMESCFWRSAKTSYPLNGCNKYIQPVQEAEELCCCCFLDECLCHLQLAAKGPFFL